MLRLKLKKMISFSTGDKKFDGVLVHMALVMNNPNPYEEAYLKVLNTVNSAYLHLMSLHLIFDKSMYDTYTGVETQDTPIHVTLLLLLLLKFPQPLNILSILLLLHQP